MQFIKNIVRIFKLLKILNGKIQYQDGVDTVERAIYSPVGVQNSIQTDKFKVVDFFSMVDNEHISLLVSQLSVKPNQLMVGDDNCSVLYDKSTKKMTLSANKKPIIVADDKKLTLEFNDKPIIEVDSTKLKLSFNGVEIFNTDGVNLNFNPQLLLNLIGNMGGVIFAQGGSGSPIVNMVNPDGSPDAIKQANMNSVADGSVKTKLNSLIGKYNTHGHAGNGVTPPANQETPLP